MSAPVWIWKGPPFQRALGIGCPLVGALGLFGMLVWSLTVPSFSLVAVLILALGSIALMTQFARSLFVSAIVTSSHLSLRGVVLTRECDLCDVDAFVISTRFQQRALFVVLKSGRRYLVPTMLQYKQLDKLEELRARFEQLRDSTTHVHAAS